MTETIQTQLDDLRALRLPDLQARFAELVGEETRCPNKAFLLRRIGEALEARAAQATPTEDVTAEAATPTDEAPAPVDVATDPPLADPPAPDVARTEDEEGTEPDGSRLQDLDVEQLRARYLDVVGRGHAGAERVMDADDPQRQRLARAVEGDIARATGRRYQIDLAALDERSLRELQRLLRDLDAEQRGPAGAALPLAALTAWARSGALARPHEAPRREVGAP